MAVIAASEDNTPVIDSVMYRITYKALTVSDTTKRDKHGKYEYKEDVTRLPSTPSCTEICSSIQIGCSPMNDKTR